MATLRADTISAGSKVLVADDDPVFRSIAARQLALMDAEAIEAEDGGAAWPLALRHDIDLALVDLDMPGVKGTDLIACLRSHPRTRHVPIVVITSHSSPAALQEALAAGATAYLTKPVHWSTFSTYVESLLRLGASGRRVEIEVAAARRQAAAHMLSARNAAKALLVRLDRLANAPGTAPAMAGELKSLAVGIATLAGQLDPARGESAAAPGLPAVSGARNVA